MKPTILLVLWASLAAAAPAISAPKFPRSATNPNGIAVSEESSLASPLIKRDEECALWVEIIHTIGRTQDNCNDFAIAITGGVAFIYLIAIREPGSKGERRDGNSTSSMGAPLIDFLLDSFAANGDSFESMTVMSSILKRDDSVKSVSEQVSIAGWNFQGTVLDAVAAEFGDGDGHIYVTPTLLNATGLTKRHDRPGFKISYTTRQASLLTRDHQIEMSQSFGTNWNYNANTYAMQDWIGLSKTDHNAIFYIRIIPENNGYGKECEMFVVEWPASCKMDAFATVLA
ncbi:hypothetical protein BKA64DRAFT_757802, partial [Cadophora sp. MPI-SDFR-AT-0126]